MINKDQKKKIGFIEIESSIISDFEKGFLLAIETASISKNGDIYYTGKGIDTIEDSETYLNSVSAFQLGQKYAKWKVLYDDLRKNMDKIINGRVNARLDLALTSLKKVINENLIP